MGMRSVAIAIAAMVIVGGSAFGQNASGKKARRDGPIEKAEEKVRQYRKRYEEDVQKVMDALAKELEKTNVPDANRLIRKFRDDIAARDAQATPPSPPAPNPALNRDVWEFNGHRYAILRLPAQLSWSQAKVECENRGGHMVTVETRDEQDFLNKRLAEVLAGQQQLNRNTCVWLGQYRDAAGQPFKPIDNGQSRFRNWAIDFKAASQNCAAMRMNDGTWWDAAEHNPDVYTLCEWDTVR